MNTSTTIGMYRTFSPKYSGYNSDGGGRDSYVVRSNGGLSIERGWLNIGTNKMPST
jgi:hypothetical protein